MKILKYISAVTATAVCLSAVTACSSKKPTEQSSEDVQPTEQVTEEVTTEPIVTQEITTEVLVDTYPEYPVSYPIPEHSYASDIYEAERERLKNGLKASNERDGYSGGGYVTGFGDYGAVAFKFKFDAPATQHYDISFGVASNKPVNCVVSVDGAELYRFTTTDDGNFQKITHYGVFLEKGMNEIEILPEGEIMLDYLAIENSVSVNSINYNVTDTPVNSNASDSAKELMKFLADNFGNYTLTGQYVSGTDNAEIELIHKTTGKYPVIRCVSIGDIPASDNILPDVQACIDWHEKGGINSITWDWKSPDLASSVYMQDCNFSIVNAFTDTEIWNYSLEQVYDLYTQNYISEECYKLIASMDEFARRILIPLQEKDIPVLWRPMYDASLGYDSDEGAVYWWGASGAEAYQWLWKLMYKRYTNYLKINNLIWVWNGMSEVYTVDSSLYDIASYDLYVGEGNKFGSRLEQLMASQRYIDGKLIAVSECDNIPDINAEFRDNAVWSFFGLWGGDYVMENGGLSERYTTKDEFIHAYNSEGVLTLDKYRTILAGGQLSVGKRNFSKDLAEDYTPPTEAVTAGDTNTEEYDEYDYEDDYQDYDYEEDYDDYENEYPDDYYYED